LDPTLDNLTLFWSIYRRFQLPVPFQVSKDSIHAVRCAIIPGFMQYVLHSKGQHMLYLAMLQQVITNTATSYQLTIGYTLYDLLLLKSVAGYIFSVSVSLYISGSAINLSWSMTLRHWIFE